MVNLPPLLGSLLLFAQDSDTHLLPPMFWRGFLSTVLYGVFGLGLILLGFKLFDWITPRMDIEKELSEKHNIAVGIVVAAIILGVCIVVASVVH